MTMHTDLGQRTDPALRTDAGQRTGAGQHAAQHAAQRADLALLTQRIRTYALDLGYSAVGFAPANDFDEYLNVMAGKDAGERYDWWATGPREPLAWAKPQKMVPGTQSLIVLVYNYAQVRFPEALCKQVGRIYQSRSYLAKPGNINAARLELMQRFLKELGIESTDAPWLPQRWAGVRCGLTSFGKNTFAYAPGLGSFLVLTTLLVPTQLEYDKPGPANTCPEDCTLCLEACPTGALKAPYTLEPRRCIPFNNWMPYVSIIPRELRPQFEGRIHGCDACQEACPRNKAVLAANATRPRDELLELLARELTLEQLLHLTPEYYELRVRPIMYNYIQDTRLFQRNAAVAMGNSGQQRYVSELLQELDNESELIRAHVVWALGVLGGTEAVDALKKRQAIEHNEAVLQELEVALA